VAESKDKESSDEKAKQLETSLAQTQTQLAEAQTKLMDTEAEVQRLQQSVDETNKKVSLDSFAHFTTRFHRISIRQVEELAATLTKEQTTNTERQTRMKTVISTARNRIQELSDQNNALKSELAELRNRANEVQARPEGTSG
jgi:peptidoglycan hydrolase CwlO-like protein